MYISGAMSFELSHHFQALFEALIGRRSSATQPKLIMPALHLPARVQPPSRKYIGLPPWTVKNEQVLLEPYNYLSSIPGKDLRTQLLQAFNVWYNVPKATFEIIADCVGMLHNASLLFDDIEDFSELRRGHPVAHKVYGLPRTINTAAYACYVAMHKLFSIKDLPAVCQLNLQAICLEEILELHRGQGLELYWRDTLTCPTEEEYFTMVKQKTGGLFRLGIRLMAACSPTVVLDATPVVDLFSVFFQIRDDVMNLDSTDYALKKGFAEDITEGKFSFPVVHSIKTNSSDSFVLDNLAKHTDDHELKFAVVDYMRNKTRSLEYARTVLKDVEGRMRQEIASMGGNEPLVKIIDKLHVSD